MSEADLVWAASALIVVLIVLPYALHFRRRNLRDHERKQEARHLGIDRPVAQFPFIDAGRCIGCGACVDACPEGDVLGVVGGTATVVNGLRCVGHGLCATACPVGAIEVGLGDVRGRDDIPVLDEWGETSVPGVFVVGELGGLALIRNAIHQGQRAAERILERVRRQPHRDAADLVVIGAGPAGLSTALFAVEHGLRPVLLDQESDLGGSILHYPRRKLVLVQPVALPFGGSLRGGECAKEELLETLQALLGRARLAIRFGARMQTFLRSDGSVHVATSAGAFKAGNVVLALGRRGSPRKLGVPGEELPNVMYKLIDAESYRGARILVVGGGDSAVEAALGLGRDGRNEVTLSYRREKIVRVKRRNAERLDDLVARRRVRLVMPSEVQEIRTDSVLLRAPSGLQELASDAVFVFAGGDPPLPLLQQGGIAFGGSQ